MPTDEYSIEHILPQNDNLRVEWRAALGLDWQQIKAKYLHSLGNLTLTGYNSEYSDRPFVEKRDIPGGFRESPLRLNRGLGLLDSWNETTILDRATSLAGEALAIWKRPALPAEKLADFQERRTGTDYTIEDHPNLLRPLRRAHFEQLRESVLALDPSVSIEFLKVRVAFRAESTFLDVVPQAGRLLLVLNVPMSELRDERGIARDVSDVGHWGAGDTQVPLEDASDFTYVMGLVRQAYDYQMSNE